MIRKACAAVLAGLLLLSTAATAAEASTPSPGALFNNPNGKWAVKNRLLLHVRSAIASTPRHETIRIAAYSFDRKDIADALMSACRRHVAVQMVLNDNWTSSQTRRLRRQLGTTIRPHWGDRCNPVRRGPARDPWPEPSFVKVCHLSCRGIGGNQHMKYYLFSRSGRATDVVMVGSSNLTNYAVVFQWNDLFTFVDNPGMYDLYSEVYHQLAEDKPQAHPYLVRTVGAIENRFGPDPGISLYNDPISQRLRQVRCHASHGTGLHGHTVIRIVMYGWRGVRGNYLARRVADLDRHGCDVRTILSAPGGKVIHKLRHAGVLVRSADLDLDNDPTDGFGGNGFERFTHEKYMLLSGGYGSTSSRIVWTGSENWSDKSPKNDEVNVRIPRNGAYHRYRDNFNWIWAHGSRRY